MPASARTHTTRATSSSPSSSSKSSSASSWKPYDLRSPIAGSPPKTRSRAGDRSLSKRPNRTRKIPRSKVPRAPPARVESDIQPHHPAEADTDGRLEADADVNVDAAADALLNAHPSVDADADKSNTKSELSSTTANPTIDSDLSADADTNANTPLDHPGLPTYATYNRIETDYLRSLSPRKRDKALITQIMFDKIWDVLHQPEACSIETPQFRFWVRKMFTLVRPTVDGGGGATGTGTGVEARTGTGMGTGMEAEWTNAGMDIGIGWASMGRAAAGIHANSDSEGEEADLELERAMGIGRAVSTNELLLTAVVLHENRPVAIREQLYELFCYCHVRAGHGGRDKTCAVIRQHYSWVPKELTAQFVKACPTCMRKKSGQAGVSVDVGLASGLVHRGASGQREKRGRVKVAAEEMPVSIVPSSLGGGAGWPTTGGPLDPANPQPCGLRERQREREWGWLRPHEEAKTIGQSSPVSSPVDGRRTTQPLPNVETWSSSGWGTGVVPRTLTLDASPFGDATYSFGSPPPLAVDSRIRDNWGEKRSPLRRTATELPSLASALSNESLDDNVNLSGLVGPDTICNGSGPDNAVATAGECLPPALRPLRLSGPVISSDIELDPPLVASSTSRSSYLFQIDPVLLSYDYPGMDSMGTWGPSGTTVASSEAACYCPGTDVMPLSLDLSMSMSMSMSTGMIVETETMLPCGGEERLGGERARDLDLGPGPNNPTSSPGLPGLYDRLRALSSDSDELDAPDLDLDLDVYAEGDLDADAESRHGLETPELDRSTGSVSSSEDSPDSSLDSDGAVLTRTYGDTDKYLWEV